MLPAGGRRLLTHVLKFAFLGGFHETDPRKVGWLKESLE